MAIIYFVSLFPLGALPHAQCQCARVSWVHRVLAALRAAPEPAFPLQLPRHFATPMLRQQVRRAAAARKQSIKQGENMRNIHQEITAKLIQKIESGNTSPWRCPWVGSGQPTLPYNAASGKPYQGVNVLLLWSAADEFGYGSNGWLTYKQAKDLGGHVRKGEKGMQGIFYKIIEPEAESKQDKKDQKTKIITKAFTVFNLDQIEDLNDDLLSDSETQEPLSIDDLAKPYLQHENIRVVTGGNRAYYSPRLDLIRLPNGFHHQDNISAILAHEIAHSTGHKKRLNRFSENHQDFSGGDDAYAFEELVAELCSCFWCAKAGVDSTRADHENYLAHWLKALKNDSRFFFKAAKAADTALKYIDAIVTQQQVLLKAG